MLTLTMGIVLSVTLSGAEAISSEPDHSREWPLRFGVDDAGGPHPLYKHPKAAELFEEFGFDVWVMHYLPPAGYQFMSRDAHVQTLRDEGVDLEAYGFEDAPDLAATIHYIRAVDAWCGEQGIEWIANLESANWIASYVDGRGNEWYHHEDGRHFWRFPDSVFEELTQTENLLGVMFDEPEHMQSTSQPERAERHNIAGLGHPFMYDPAGDQLEDAADRFYEAVKAEAEPYLEHGLKVYTEHVFPILFHGFARAGYIAAPKVLKESWSPIVAAIAMGAAIQYDTEFWITPDLWGNYGYPSHSPDAYRSALLLAYHLGADGIYTENLAFDHERRGYGSLVYMTDDEYRVTPHGEVTKWFIHEYVPENPRRYTFRQLRPRVAIVRQPDGCWGQATSWLPDTLFGHPEWNSTLETEAWFRIWHLLTLGVVPADGLNWHCGVAARQPHRVFAPLDGVVVFDHHVKERHLQDVEAIFLTGVGITPEGLDAISSRVQEGAICFTLPHLAPDRVREGADDSGVFEDGAGTWVVSDDFLAPEVRRRVAPFFPAHDTIRYQFGDATVRLRMLDDDPNRIEAGVVWPQTEEAS